MLNSDWPQIEIHFKKMLHIPIKKEVKAAEIVKFSFSIDDTVQSNSISKSTAQPSTSDNNTARKKKNKKNKKKKE